MSQYESTSFYSSTVFLEEEEEGGINLNPKSDMRKDRGRFGVRSSHTLKYCHECHKASKNSNSKIVYCELHNDKVRVSVSQTSNWNAQVTSLDKHKGWEKIEEIKKQNEGNTFLVKQGCVLSVVREGNEKNRFYTEKEDEENDGSKKLTKRQAKKLAWKNKEIEERKKMELETSEKSLKQQQQQQQQPEDEIVSLSEIRSKNPKVAKRLNKPTKVTPASSNESIRVRNDVDFALAIQLPSEKSKPSPRAYCCDVNVEKEVIRKSCRAASNKQLISDFYVQKYVRL